MPRTTSNTDVMAALAAKLAFADAVIAAARKYGLIKVHGRPAGAKNKRPRQARPAEARVARRANGADRPRSQHRDAVAQDAD